MQLRVQFLCVPILFWKQKNPDITKPLTCLSLLLEIFVSFFSEIKRCIELHNISNIKGIRRTNSLTGDRLYFGVKEPNLHSSSLVLKNQHRMRVMTMGHLIVLCGFTRHPCFVAGKVETPWSLPNIIKRKGFGWHHLHFQCVAFALTLIWLDAVFPSPSKRPSQFNDIDIQSRQ